MSHVFVDDERLKKFQMQSYNGYVSTLETSGFSATMAVSNVYNPEV